MVISGVIPYDVAITLDKDEIEIANAAIKLNEKLQKEEFNNKK